MNGLQDTRGRYAYRASEAGVKIDLIIGEHIETWKTSKNIRIIRIPTAFLNIHGLFPQ